jgi:hypothetical protein
MYYVYAVDSVNILSLKGCVFETQNMNVLEFVVGKTDADWKYVVQKG